MTQESLDLLQEVMEQAGELDQRAPHDKIVDNSFAQETMEALG